MSKNQGEALKENQPAVPAVPAPAAAPEAARPEELAELQAEAELLGNQASPASEAMAAAQAAAVNQGEQQWAALVEQLGCAASPILCPNWEMGRAEWAALGQAWAPILQQYFPDASSLGPWPGAILATALIVAPRIGRPLRAPEPEAGKGEGQADG